MKTPLAVDSICYLFSVTDPAFENEVIRVLGEHEKTIRKDEQNKLAGVHDDGDLMERGNPTMVFSFKK